MDDSHGRQVYGDRMDSSYVIYPMNGVFVLPHSLWGPATIQVYAELGINTVLEPQMDENMLNWDYGQPVHCWQ